MKLGLQVGLGPGHIVLDGDPAPSPPKGCAPQFSLYLLRPNGCMEQDVTWYGAKPRPRRLCDRWRTSPPSPTRGRSPQIFGPCLLWPNGWMDQDATWYRGRPRPTRHCVRCGPSYPQKKGHPILAHVYCGQMAGWMKTPLSTEIDLGAGPIVLDGVPAPAKGAQHPLFSAHVYCGHGRPSQLLLSSS